MPPQVRSCSPPHLSQARPGQRWHRSSRGWLWSRFSNDSQVQDTLTSALDDGTAVLVADAGRTTFCGCSGVTALLHTHHRAAAAGAQLRVVVGSPPMRRVLELTAADQALNTYPTLAAALADGQTPNRS